MSLRNFLQTFALAILAATWLAGSPAGAADLTVMVTHLRSDDGDVHMAIYDTPEKFPDSDGMLKEVKVPVSGKTAQTTFRNLQPGAYAIAVYHDENGNHEFDQGLFGIPLEDYAFSSNAKAFFAPPSFNEAAFQLAQSRSIDIPMNSGPP